MSHYFINDQNLKDNPKIYTTKVGNYEFSFETNSGVFAKQGFDFGSRLLVEALLSVNLTGNVLDLGCGYGPVGVILGKHFNIKLDLTDVNVDALKLANSNLELNQVSGNVILSDAYGNITSKYDYIITNPPIRAGKKKVYELIFGARDYLKDNGELWIVIRKEQGAKSLLRDMENTYKTDIVIKNKGFYVIKCQFC